MLAATLIVRDEARSIARCLDSVRGWTDRMVVVDTGSTDATAEIARSAGAEVHHFSWCDDFAAARNHALDCADADWNLMIDADEWLVSGGPAIRRWTIGSPRLGVLCVESSFDSGTNGQSTNRSWITRLLPRGVRYVGRVHEQVDSPLERHRLQAVLGHDGYLDALLARKAGRNRRLLQHELIDRPDDPYILFQLGREMERDGATQEATSLYARAERATPATASWRHDLTVRYLYLLTRTGQLADALALAEREVDRWPLSPDIHFVTGSLMLECAISDRQRAIGNWLPMAIQAWEHCLTIGEQPDLEGSVAGRGSHLAQHNLDMVRAQMASLSRLT